MQNSTRKRLSTEEAYKIFKEILEEDKQEGEDEDSSEDCLADCAEDDLPVVEKKFCECIRIAENSSRFSLRVMEAMRSLQNDEDDFLPTSSIDDIVDYIQKNYRDDGDLYAQVRTALKQVCSQGFAMELLENEYHLIGPDAASMNRLTCSNSPKDCSLSHPVKIPKSRKKDGSKNPCICETPYDEETGRTASKRQRVSKGAAARDLERTNSKREQNNREEDRLTEETECSSTSTDEDNVSEIQEKTQHASEKKDPKRRKSVHKPVMGASSIRRINNQTMGTGDARKDRAAEILKEMDEEDFETNKADESQNQIRSKKAIETEKELERWIERCRKECERRKDRRPRNN